MELGFHVPIFDIDGGVTAIAGELARVGTAAEESGATWLSFGPGIGALLVLRVLRGFEGQLRSRRLEMPPTR
jgi:hypothetical protein